MPVLAENFWAPFCPHQISWFFNNSKYQSKLNNSIVQINFRLQISTHDSHDLSDNLRFIVVDVMSVDECREKYTSAKLSTNFIHTNSSFCGRNHKGRRLSHGDIGNPLVSLKNQLIGMASAFSEYTDNTMRTMPDIYTSVFPFVDWIRSYIHGAE